jgi:hypothetical protein
MPPQQSGRPLDVVDDALDLCAHAGGFIYSVAPAQPLCRKQEKPNE